MKDLTTLPILISMEESILESLDIKNEGENSRFFHRSIGVEETDLDSIYDRINNIFYLVEKNKNNSKFRFMTSIPYKEDIAIPSIEEFITLNKDEVRTKEALEEVLLMFDYKNELDTSNKLIYLIKNNSSTEQTILYYGNIDKAMVLFLFFKSFMGVNIFYFSLDKNCDDFFKTLDKGNLLSTLDEKENTTENIEFPSRKLINRQTLAYTASKEISEIMSSNSDYQLGDKKIFSINLITTYDEVKIILKEDAKVRPKFSVDEENIYIPNIVTKISGVEKDFKSYRSYVKDILNTKSAIIFDLSSKTNALRPNGPLSKSTLKKYCNFENNNVYIDTEKFANCKDFPHNFLKIEAQMVYLKAINILINSNDIFQFSINSEEKLDMALTLLKISFPDICNLLHFIPSLTEMPKVFIFSHKELRSDKARNLSILIAFMGLIGFDVVLFEPSGYINVERFLKKQVMTLHKLDNVKLGLTYKKIIKKSLFF